MINFEGSRWVWPDNGLNMKKLVMLSALFHIGLVVIVTLLSMAFSSRRFEPQVYHVGLVDLLRSEPKVVREKPAPKKASPPKAVVKKRPVRPRDKPPSPTAVIPPLKKSKEKPEEKRVTPDEPEAVSPSQSETRAAIPSPEVKMEAGVDLPNFGFPYYLDLIQRKIGRHWAPPPLKSTDGLSEVVVVFVLYPDGQIKNIVIEKKSGNAFFDQAALRAVYQANPLPPLPQGIFDKSLKVHFNFSIVKKG